MKNTKLPRYERLLFGDDWVGHERNLTGHRAWRSARRIFRRSIWRLSTLSTPAGVVWRSSWSKVLRELLREKSERWWCLDNTKVKYYQEKSNPALANFCPFDVEAWWGRRLYQNITNGLWHSSYPTGRKYRSVYYEASSYKNNVNFRKLRRQERVLTKIYRSEDQQV